MTLPCLRKGLIPELRIGQKMQAVVTESQVRTKESHWHFSKCAGAKSFNFLLLSCMAMPLIWCHNILNMFKLNANTYFSVLINVCTK